MELNPPLRYRTIVADPPWDIGDRLGWSRVDGKKERVDRSLPYRTLTEREISALPVRELSYADYSGQSRKSRREAGEVDHDGSHLFLWATTSVVEAAHRVSREWGFTPSALLVWCKEPRGFNVGGLFQANVEFIVYARRGSPAAHGSHNSRWFTWPRGRHSQKPEAFQDLIESIFPGPYLDLFARRQRLGWDTWGDEALNHVELTA